MICFRTIGGVDFLFSGSRFRHGRRCPPLSCFDPAICCKPELGTEYWVAADDESIVYPM